MSRLIRLLRRVAVATAILCAGGALVLVAWVAWPLPASMLAPASRDQGVVVVDRTGLVLRSTRASDGSQARWVPYEQLDPDLINAFVAVEDRRFWEHPGIDMRAVLRAMRDDIRAGRIVSGASTITMQLARLVEPAPRSWSGKVRQLAWALRLEQHLGKQRILEEYLNRIELGQATVGVGAASATYFGSAASSVSLAQAATIAGLAHAPSRDNPFASPARATRRRDRVLVRMRALGSARAADVARATAEPFATVRSAPPFLAPHFTTRVLGWLATVDSMRGRWSMVQTSLDLSLQTELEAEVRHAVDVLRDRGVEQAAVVVLDNAAGEVRAWVGSPDFWSSDDGQTDMVVSRRQPGSALKPFLYALALDRGTTAATVLPDVPKAYATATGAYAPRNYDRRFRGPVRAREALASSYNVPAVELASRVGAGAFLLTLHRAGFASLDRDADYYGLGLALGNGDVTLLELANAYRALANDGRWRPWSWRSDGSTDAPRGPRTGDRVHADDIPDASGADRRVASPVASAIVLDMLSDAAARIPAFGVSTPFDFPFPVAVKTGTSRHFTDNWAVGTTRGFTVAVWAGNFTGHTMQGVSGVTGAGPLLHRAVMATARRIAPGALVTPAEAGAVAVPICRLSGLGATAQCARMTEWFAPGTEPDRPDDWERNGTIRLPIEYAEWSRGQLAPIGGTALLAAPRSALARGLGSPRSDVDGDRAPVRFTMLSPRDGDRYAIPAGIDARYATIPFRASGPGAGRVRWSVDGRAHDGGRWQLAEGTHVVRATSAAGDVVEARISVER